MPYSQRVNTGKRAREKKLTKLPSAEWDFGDLPRNEAKQCLEYEYFREFVKTCPAALQIMHRLKDGGISYRAYKDLHAKIVQIVHLTELTEQRDASKTRPAKVSTTASTGEMDNFAQTVGAILTSWNYPDQERVIFSEDDQDLVIGGNPSAKTP